MAEIPNSNNTLSAKDLAETYALHPLDHPGMLLVSKVCDGNGFGSWKRAMLLPYPVKKNCFSQMES